MIGAICGYLFPKNDNSCKKMTLENVSNLRLWFQGPGVDLEDIGLDFRTTSRERKGECA